jgi:hypothetical protein
MPECGLIFNRHNWRVLGWGSNFTKYQACDKCGTVQKLQVYGISVYGSESNLHDALADIRRNSEKESEKANVISYLKTVT